MKFKTLAVLLISIFVLSSCSPREVEHYESKKVHTSSVFDNINVPPKAIRESMKENDEETFDETNNPIETNDENPNNGDEVQGKTMITNDYVNLRTEPFISDNNVIITIEPNIEVTIIEEIQGEDELWMRVSVDGQQGFVRSDYLTVE